MITAIAIDDEPPALKIVENFCEKMDGINLEKTFTNPAEALKFVNKFPIDLLFLDISMPSLTGIQFCKSIKQDVMVIFTTGFSDYAVESYDLNAIDYLLKPYSFDRFQQAVHKAKEQFNYSHTDSSGDIDHFFIRADYRLIKIYFDEILYIEGLDDYLKIHLFNKKTVVARMTLKTIISKLPVDEFIRIHRSFIIPLKRIESIKNKQVLIAGNAIPIGNSFEEEFAKKFKV